MPITQKYRKIIHHIVALYHRKNVRFYSGDDGAECILSCITLSLR